MERFEDFKKRTESMTQEERKDNLLQKTSESVRGEARHLAMLKAIALDECGIAPEDFDKAFEREYTNWSKRLVGKSGIELAIIGLAELAANGVDINDVFMEGDE